MTISTGNQEIVIGDQHQLRVTDRNQENIFSCKSNRTLSEMLRKEKYLNLSISFEEYLPEYGDMNIGAFLILLKERGDDKYKMFLNRNGDKRYCKFTLTDVDLSQKGLYVYVLNNEIKYLGRCLTNFKDRIISNYGRITATNCYKDGQDEHSQSATDKIIEEVRLRLSEVSIKIESVEDEYDEDDEYLHGIEFTLETKSIRLTYDDNGAPCVDFSDKDGQLINTLYPKDYYELALLLVPK
jgi:hypothetical protein